MNWKTSNLLLLAVLCEPAAATNYFVDGAAGKDEFSGRSPAPTAGSPATDGPWRTVNRVNTAILQAGDAVYFRCGQQWRESLIISRSGAPSSPITFGRYGDDCTEFNRPTLTGSETLTDWTQYAGNIYVTTPKFLVHQVFVDGAPVRLAQHPNRGYHPEAPDNVYLITDPYPEPTYTTTRIHDTELQPIAGRDLVGAGIHVRTNDFIIDDRTVAAFDPATNEITLDLSASRALQPGWGYYLDNKLWMLDQPGEWFFDESDPNSKRVYVWMPDNSPPGQRVSGSSDIYGINASSMSNIVIQGLRVDKAGVGIQISSSSNITIRNVEISNSHYQGILANKALNGTIDNCTITDSVREGIMAGEGADIVIANNRIVNSGVVGSPKQSRGGISTIGDRYTIKNNSVINSGYHGISYGRDSTVANNYVENACLILNDCGGIYTGNGFNFFEDAPHNSQVIGNTVTGVYGNLYGRPGNLREALTPAIYVDFRTSGVRVQSNTVSRADTGIFLHAAQDNRVYDNMIYDILTYSLRIFERPSRRIQIPNQVARNTFFPFNDNPVIALKPATTDSSLLGQFDSNHYSALYSDDPAKMILVTEKQTIDGKFRDISLTLDQWRQSGRDINASLFTTFSVAPYIYKSTNQINLLQNGTLDSGTAGWRAYSEFGDAVLGYSNNGCAGSTGCITLQSGTESPRGSIVSPPFQAQPGKHYLISFDLRTGQASQNYTVVPRLAGPASFNSIGPRHELTGNGTWRSHSLPVSAPADLTLGANANGARIDFIANPDQQISLDNVRIEEAEVTYNTPEDDSTLILNTGPTDISASCPFAQDSPSQCDQLIYFDDSTPVAWPVAVPARSSKLLIWAGNPYRR